MSLWQLLMEACWTGLALKCEVVCSLLSAQRLSL